MATCERCGRQFEPTEQDKIPAEIDEDGNVVEYVYACPECRAVEPDYDWLDEE